MTIKNLMKKRNSILKLTDCINAFKQFLKYEHV